MEFQYRSCLSTYEEELSPNERYEPPSSPVTVIGGDVWIGDNSFIKAGVCIAPGTVIGASSVVTKNTQPFSIYAGNPAQIIRMRMKESLIQRYLDSEWWHHLDIVDLKGVKFNDPEEAISQVESRLSTR